MNFHPVVSINTSETFRNCDVREAFQLCNGYAFAQLFLIKINQLKITLGNVPIHNFPISRTE